MRKYSTDNKKLNVLQLDIFHSVDIILEQFKRRYWIQSKFTGKRNFAGHMETVSGNIIFHDTCSMSVPGAIYAIAGHYSGYDFFAPDRMMHYSRKEIYDRFIDWKKIVVAMSMAFAYSFRDNQELYAHFDIYRLLPIQNFNIFEINDNMFMTKVHVLIALEHIKCILHHYDMYKITQPENVKKHIPMLRDINEYRQFAEYSRQI